MGIKKRVNYCPFKKNKFFHDGIANWYVTCNLLSRITNQEGFHLFVAGNIKIQ